MTALREIFARFGVDFDQGALVSGDDAVMDVTDHLQALSGWIASGALAAGLTALVTDFVALGDELGDTSAALGISATELQEWRHVAELSGAESGEFTAALTRLQNRMAETGEGSAIFRRLGVSVRDASGELRSASDVLTDLADPIAALSTQSERTNVLVDLLGRSGARLGPLFSRGSEGIREARAELAELGGGMSEEAVEAASELADANHRLDVSWLSLRSRIALFLVPALEALISLGSRVVTGLEGMIEHGALLEAAFAVLGPAAALAAAETIGAWAVAAAPFVAVGSAVLLLILIIEDLIVAFQGGDSAIQALADSITEQMQMLSDPSNGPIAGVIQMFQFLLGVIASTYNAVAEFTGLLPSIGDDVESLRGERGEEARLAYEIASQRRQDPSFDESLIPDQVEREQALRDAREQIASGRVPSDITRREGQSAAPTITQSVRIDRIDANGLDEEAVSRVVTDSVQRAMTAQAEDTLDLFGVG